VNPKELQFRIEGTVTSSTDDDYESLRRAIWNQSAPDRHPRHIVQVVSENDVVEAVRFARANQMRVAVRGGVTCSSVRSRITRRAIRNFS
jgi:FAD/FMN-containing dehydrogenase